MADYGANTRHTIMVSYFISTLCGLSFFSLEPSILFEPWFWPAAVEGVGFYLVFLLIAKTAQMNGVAVASIAAKMSVVIPIAMGIFMLGESANLFKVIGVSTGVLAVLLSASGGFGVKDIKWPLLVFVGSGAIDASLKLFEIALSSPDQFPALITTIFSFALLAVSAHYAVSSDRKVQTPSIVSGLFLGVANFGTIYFLLNALSQSGWESSVVYSMNNFGVVVLSMMFGMLLFREKLTHRGWLGFTLAVVSIGLIFLGTNVS